MTTGYNRASDLLVLACEAIAATEVNAAVNPTIADVSDPLRYVAIREVRRAPIPLDLIPQSKLPCLSIFIAHEEAIRMGPRYVDSIVTISFEWVGSGTPPTDLNDRWALARQVWIELVKAMRIGNHDAGSGAVDVLTPAGVVRHVLESPETVDYSLLTSETAVYPHFLGRMVLQQRLSEPDTSTLALFTELMAWINLFNAAPVPGLGTLDVSDWTGTSAPSIAGTQTASAEVLIDIIAGGTVGVSGITYALSRDDGATFEATTALGTNTTIVVDGVTLTLGAGTVVIGDSLSWSQTEKRHHLVGVHETM